MNNIQKQNTLAFIKEYTILNELKNITAEDTEEYSTSEKLVMTRTANPFNITVQRGEIRLLSQTERLTYGVVMCCSWNNCLLFPFSSFMNPATDREMYISDAEDRPLFQRVYQVWNVRTVQTSLLSQSWKMDQLSEAELQNIQALINNYWFDEELPDSLLNMTGMPIYSGSDIRIEYMESEMANFAELDAKNMMLENRIRELGSKVLQFKAFEYELQAAAGKNALSKLYVSDGESFNFVMGIELEAFEKVEECSVLPHFTWFTDDALTQEYKNNSVMFHHGPTGKMLGTGVIQSAGKGMEIILLNPVDKDDVPAIGNPDEIQIVIEKGC